MPEQMKPITSGIISTGSSYIIASGIVGCQQTDTQTSAEQVRTVVTSTISGNISLRYAPRIPKSPGASETAS